MGKVAKVISEYMAQLARRRAKSLTAARRSEIAKKASLARWASKEKAK